MDDRATKLLLKAVRQLPEREQDQLLTALLMAAGGPPPPALFERLVPEEAATAVRSAFGPMTFTQAVPGGPQSDVLMRARPGTPVPTEMTGPAAMLPVRLPPELHERLRAWSGEHGFSMASVVRGLVERFLDEQAGRRRRSSGASTKPMPKPTPKAKPKRSTARG